MSIAVERQYLSTRALLRSVAKGNTRAHEMNGLCGCRVFHVPNGWFQLKFWTNDLFLTNRYP